MNMRVLKKARVLAVSEGSNTPQSPAMAEVAEVAAVAAGVRVAVEVDVRRAGQRRI